MWVVLLRDSCSGFFCYCLFSFSLVVPNRKSFKFVCLVKFDLCLRSVEISVFVKKEPWYPGVFSSLRSFRLLLLVFCLLWSSYFSASWRKWLKCPCGHSAAWVVRAACWCGRLCMTAVRKLLLLIMAGGPWLRLFKY